MLLRLKAAHGRGVGPTPNVVVFPFASASVGVFGSWGLGPAGLHHLVQLP